jgi:vacuolar-type H+-ATPase subunit E/Vma4
MENLKAQVRFLHEMETKEIAEEATSKAEKILAEAKEKAVKTTNQKMAEKSRAVEETGERELAQAKTDSRNKILNTRFRLFEETMAEFEEHLREIIKDNARYSESLNRLIIEAASKLSGNEFEIVTNSRDREFVSKNLEQLKIRISSLKRQPVKLRIGKETIDTIGGAIVRTADQKQIFNDTLEARIDDFRKESGQKIYEILFEGAED